jgi:ElaB/YqjD/DUF883 family membrane-anchored ribosome-binding protein
VSTHIHSNSPANQLSEATREIARQAADGARDNYQTLTTKFDEGFDRTRGYAQHAVDVTKDAAHRATDTAKDIYQSAALRAEDTLATSKDYVRRNPVPVVLGAIAFGAALGYLILNSRRKPTFRERHADEPLAAVREAILTALAPVTQRVHEGYDSARNHADRTVHSFSDQIGRVGSNLKFW